MTDQAAPISKDIAAIFEWWRSAGVDLDFVDDATAWLVEQSQDETGDVASKEAGELVERAPSSNSPDHAPKTPQATPADLLGDSPPGTLEAFRQFWLEAPGLDTIGPRGRIPPRGPHNARLMMLTVDPEESDRETLLSGPQGRLVARMLAAMGADQNEVYLASALPRHTPMADAMALANGGMGSVLALHIKLAAPKAVIAFGKNILPLLGHELTKDVASLREINQGVSPMPLLVSEGLDSLMASPRLKARFWRRWMEWSAEQ